MNENKNRIYPEHIELSNFLRVFQKENDRGASLVAVSLLNQRLFEILNSFFANVKESESLLSGYFAPLGIFSTRINASYSLGLIQESELFEMDIVRKIRNEFAHNWEDINFETENIKDLCNELPWLGPKDLEETSTSRDRYIFAVIILSIDLMWRQKLVSNEKREIKNWPNTTR